MRCFVTVGTTKFDGLLAAVVDQDFLKQLGYKGYTSLLIQAGSSEFDESILEKHKELPNVEWYKYKSDIETDILKADLVISHAGAGSSLEIMYAKKPCIVVVNDRLMGNHQQELASKLSELGHIKDTVPGSLLSTLKSFDASELTHYERGDPSLLSQHLHSLMGMKYSE